MSIFIIVCNGLLQNIKTSLSKLVHHLFFSFLLHFKNIRFDFFSCLLFEFLASQIGDHDSLVRQVQFLLSFDLFPGSVYKQSQSIHWYILGFQARKQCIISSDIESLPEHRTSLRKLLLFIEFVWEHTVFKVEEIWRFGILELFGFVYLIPDILYILVNSLLNHIKIVLPVFKITEHKDQFLSWRLAKKLEVYFKNDT